MRPESDNTLPAVTRNQLTRLVAIEETLARVEDALGISHHASSIRIPQGKPHLANIQLINLALAAIEDRAGNLALNTIGVNPFSNLVPHGPCSPAEPAEALSVRERAIIDAVTKRFVNELDAHRSQEQQAAVPQQSGKASAKGRKRAA